MLQKMNNKTNEVNLENMCTLLEYTFMLCTECKWYLFCFFVSHVKPAIRLRVRANTLGL